MSYTPSFNNPYPYGWQNLPDESTPVTAEALQSYSDAVEHIETYLADNEIINPVPPVIDGTYVLKATVVDGVATYVWILEEQEEITE